MDINNLGPLFMANMWHSRDKPTWLEFEAIVDGSFVFKEPIKSAFLSSNSKGKVNSHASDSEGPPLQQKRGLKYQRALTLQDNLPFGIKVDSRLLLWSVVNEDIGTDRLVSRVRAGENTIVFDEDDDDTPDFVTVALNLWSVAYLIEHKTRWEVKGDLSRVLSFARC